MASIAAPFRGSKKSWPSPSTLWSAASRPHRQRPCCGRAEQRDELPSLQLIELHPIPHRGGTARRRISKPQRSVSGYRGHFATGQRRRCPSRVKLRNTQHEQMSSALPPRTDVGSARPKRCADRVLWKFVHVMSAWASIVLQKSFGPMNTIFPGYRRSDRIIMWGTTSIAAELIGNSVARLRTHRSAIVAWFVS